MGPIIDESGLEQGEVPSSDLYKIYGKEQLISAQDSSLGVKIEDDIHKLHILLKLTEEICKRYHVMETNPWWQEDLLCQHSWACGAA